MNEEINQDNTKYTKQNKTTQTRLSKKPRRRPHEAASSTYS